MQMRKTVLLVASMAVALLLSGMVALVTTFATAKVVSAQDTKFVRAPRDAFVFNCDFRRAAPIDPIVYPGKYGVSHRHVFFGGKVTKDSTYQQLRRAGTTCEDSEHKTGYWIPALRRNGEEIPVIRTDAKFYYGVPEGTPTADLQPLPRGVKVIAGSGQSTGPQYGIVDWGCGKSPSGGGSDGKKRGYLAPVDCDPDSSNPYVNLTVHFPSCWTGAKDSSDHKSHAAYPVGYPQDPAAWRCPEGYPIRTPRLDLTVRFRTSNADNLRLSSGSIYSMHADMFEASNQAEFQRLINTEL
jgi:hypothetical protein